MWGRDGRASSSPRPASRQSGHWSLLFLWVRQGQAARASGRVGAERVAGKRVGVRQNLVDVADFVPAWSVRIVMRQAPAGRTAGTQRRDTVNAARRKRLVAPRFPTGESPCLSRQVVQDAAEGCQAQGKARGADRVVWRGRAGDGKRPGQAGDRDARKAARHRPPAAHSNGAAGRTTAGRAARRGGRGPALGRKPRGITMPVQMPLRSIDCPGSGLRRRAGGKATTIPRAATMISRRAAASAGRSRLSTARWRWRGRVSAARKYLIFG